MNRNPNWILIDIGAHIGHYSLFAAKLNRKAVAIEPFIDNVRRLHKAATLNNIQHNILVIQNALFNERKLMLLESQHSNLGSQMLSEEKSRHLKRNEHDRYQVDTILLDDIVPYLPANANEAILKIDIEGFEPFVFQNASKLFDRLDIKIIYMEFGPSRSNELIETETRDMLSFLVRRGFKPYAFGIPLQIEKFKSWPFDMQWFK